MHQAGKLSTSLYGWGYGGARSPVCDPIWQVTLRSSVMGFHKKLYTPLPFYLFH